MKPWWGNFNFIADAMHYWQLGFCSFWIERNAQQWRIAYQYNDEKNNEKLIVAANELPKLKPLNFNRYTFKETLENIQLIPVLADRPQVSRPEFSFAIGAFESVTLFVSAAAWARIETDQPGKLLQEIPLQRLSDTWFGDNTLEGELCYASRTRCRLQLDYNTLQPYRVTIPVIIRNQTAKNLLVQRLKLPLPFLSVYSDEKNNLWSNTIVIENSASANSFTTIRDTALLFDAKLTLLSGPRITEKPSSILNLLSQVL